MDRGAWQSTGPQKNQTQTSDYITRTNLMEEYINLHFEGILELGKIGGIITISMPLETAGLV